MKNRYLALARVSSREQQREGFSLEVQEEAVERYATQRGGSIVKMFRIAETASKPDERRTFRELLAYAKANAAKLTAVLFFKVDRAARNLFDYVELERLEVDYGLEVIYVTQTTENTPAGRMMRRTLANMASFYTEQQSLDVQDGLERRVQNGLFPNKAPYGYRNVRIEGRSIVEIDLDNAPKVRRIFEMYGYEGHSLDTLNAALLKEGLAYSEASREFPRSKLYTILNDRAYLGDVRFRGQWCAGSHEPLIDRAIWDRVQTLLGGKIYRTHELTFACEFIRCGFCGRPVTGERKIKRTKHGEQAYVYYRCTRYNTDGHPRLRVREADLDREIISLFERIRIKDEKVQRWFRDVLRARLREGANADEARLSEVRRQRSSLQQQCDRLLNMRLGDEIDEAIFAEKSTELRDRIARLESEAASHSDKQRSDTAEKLFELSQTLTQKWLSASVRTKRRLLEIVCLNFSLDGATLVPTMRKPFDVLAEGLSVPLSRGDKI